MGAYKQAFNRTLQSIKSKYQRHARYENEAASSVSPEHILKEVCDSFTGSHSSKRLGSTKVTPIPVDKSIKEFTRRNVRNIKKVKLDSHEKFNQLQEEYKTYLFLMSQTGGQFPDVDPLRRKIREETFKPVEAENDRPVFNDLKEVLKFSNHDIGASNIECK